MNKYVAITGKYDDGKQFQIFIGEIEILNFDDKHKTAYVTWKIKNKQSLEITSLTKNYFFGSGESSYEEVINLVLIDIQNYRMNRRKVFSEIKFSEK